MNVVVSSIKNVEDLRSGEKKNHRIRKVRHRAQKRYHKNQTSLKTKEEKECRIVPAEKEMKIENLSEKLEKNFEVIVPVPKVTTVNQLDLTEKDSIKSLKRKLVNESMQTTKKDSLPIVDICRDRRRRITSIRRSSSENISRNAIAFALKPQYSVQKTALKHSFKPTWAQFSLLWNENTLDSLRNVKINSEKTNLPLITLAA